MQSGWTAVGPVRASTNVEALPHSRLGAVACADVSETLARDEDRVRRSTARRLQSFKSRRDWWAEENDRDRLYHAATSAPPSSSSAAEVEVQHYSVTIGDVPARGSPDARESGDELEAMLMLRQMRDMPVGTIGFEAVGEVEDDDWEDTVGPVLRQQIAGGGKVRLLYLLGPEATEVEGDAMKADTGFRARHATSFDRVAVVSDEDWIRPALSTLSFLLPGKAKGFRVADLADAKAWLAADPD